MRCEPPCAPARPHSPDSNADSNPGACPWTPRTDPGLSPAFHACGAPRWTPADASHRPSTPLRGRLRGPGRVRLPRTPATDFVPKTAHSRALGDPFAADLRGRNPPFDSNAGARTWTTVDSARVGALGSERRQREGTRCGFATASRGHDRRRVRIIAVVTRSVQLCTMVVPTARRDREGGNRWATRAQRTQPRRRSRRRTPSPRRSSRSSSAGQPSWPQYYDPEPMSRRRKSANATTMNPIV